MSQQTLCDGSNRHACNNSRATGGGVYCAVRAEAIYNEDQLPLAVGEMSAPPLPLKHNQQVPSQSVQAPNANSSSLDDVFTVVATIFQQIMTELNRTSQKKTG
jgi:hypothetical protein